MKVKIKRGDNTITLKGSPGEITQVMDAMRGQAVMLEAPNPQALTLNDPRRYQATGRVTDYGGQEAFDVRTGRRGAFLDWAGHFVPGALVRDDGRVEWEHPWDNPLQGWRV